MYTGTGEGQEHRKLHVQQEKDTPRIVILQTLEDLLHYHFDVVERATELTRGITLAYASMQATAMEDARERDVFAEQTMRLRVRGKR
jgi:hypothetical protein